jgi:hypothetical protein
MEGIKKQRISRSSIVTLRNQLLRYMKCFKKLFLMILCVGQKPSNGSHMSKFAKLQLRAWNVQVTSCEVDEVKMWKNCIRSSMRLVRPIIQCMLMHFNCRFKREVDFWKICALSTE